MGHGGVRARTGAPAAQHRHGLRNLLTRSAPAVDPPTDAPIAASVLEGGYPADNDCTRFPGLRHGTALQPG